MGTAEKESGTAHRTREDFPPQDREFTAARFWISRAGEGRCLRQIQEQRGQRGAQSGLRAPSIPKREPSRLAHCGLVVPSPRQETPRLRIVDLNQAEERSSAVGVLDIHLVFKSGRGLGDADRRTGIGLGSGLAASRGRASCEGNDGYK